MAEGTTARAGGGQRGGRVWTEGQLERKERWVRPIPGPLPVSCVAWTLLASVLGEGRAGGTAAPGDRPRGPAWPQTPRAQECSLSLVSPLSAQLDPAVCLSTVHPEAGRQESLHPNVDSQLLGPRNSTPSAEGTSKL